MNNKSVQYFFLISILLVAVQPVCLAQNKNNIPLLQARFITGDNDAYKLMDYDDTQWEQQKLGDVWQSQGHENYHGYAWYRIHVTLPSSLKNDASWKDSLRIFLAHVNDVDETFLNGTRIGHIGSFPDEPGGYISKWPAVREYHIPLISNTIKWDADNVIAIKVFDGGGSGGIFMGQPYIDALEKVNGISIAMDNQKIIYQQKNAIVTVDIVNKYNSTTNGSLQYMIVDEVNNKSIETKELPFSITPFQKKSLQLTMPDHEGITVTINFKESLSALTTAISKSLPYLLTPAPGGFPAIHNAAVTGLGAGHPLIYKIAATGKAPLAYSIKDLPQGLQLDAAKGIITGTISGEGDYNFQLIVKNSKGSAKKGITLRVGKLLALTPPMGWNSWNCWGTSVSSEKVVQSANALLSKGLADHGWSYINIDDGWEAKQRSANGAIQANEKFPDMKKLGDHLHSNGLRFGIYSSPGTHTCGGFLGSYAHELSDAATYSSWGIDYLKYDLCSYLDSMKNNVSLTDHQAPYKVMEDALSRQHRDIIYSLCQYGIKDVWKWGDAVNGNSWRTTEDIEDTWQSLRAIGFAQDTLYKYAKPGRWNDPDMLTVGMVGWGENLHPTRLTADEQYTQISLWCMLSAPLLLGCDLKSLDNFTLNLLTNDEVIAVDQDILGKQAMKMMDKDSLQVWVKQMADGSKVLALFNISDVYKNRQLSFSDIGLTDSYIVRDVWRQQMLPGYRKAIAKTIPPHGVFLIQIKPAPKK